MTCTDRHCPFNHFRTELEFAGYRIIDPFWVRSNSLIVRKYEHGATGNKYFDAWNIYGNEDRINSDCINGDYNIY